MNEHKSIETDNALGRYAKFFDIHADPELVALGEFLGVGGFKKVYQGLYDGNAVAISVINGPAEAILHSKRKKKLLGRELRALNLLSNHPNVPKFYGFCTMHVEDPNMSQIVLINELCNRGDLEKFVETVPWLCLHYLLLLPIHTPGDRSGYTGYQHKEARLLQLKLSCVLDVTKQHVVGHRRVK